MGDVKQIDNDNSLIFRHLCNALAVTLQFLPRLLFQSL